MADTRTLKLSLLADVKKFLDGMDKADKGTKKFESSVSNYSKKMAKSFAVAGVAAGAFAIKIGLDSVKAASDLNEEVSKAEIIFGDVADEIKAFSKTADTALGLTQKEALQAASTFATFGKASGLTGKDLSKFSKSATTLAADLGAFYNTSADEAITAIGAALRGESEPIRRFGVLLNDATLKAKAMEMGLYDGKGALDLQAKSLAAYQVILDQTTDAQGNFKATSDDLAGQQKILNAQLENLKATMGTALLPVMKDVVTQANFVAAAFAGKDPQSLSERARELAGTYDGQGSGAYNLGLALTNAATAFGKLFAALTDPDAEGSANSLQTIADAVNSLASGLELLAKGFSKAKTALDWWGRNVETPFQNFLGVPESQRGITGGPQGKAAGGSVMANKPYRVGEFGPEMFVPSGSGSIRPAGNQGTTVININGVVDAASARRSIERVLQTQSRVSGPINLAGAMP